MSKFKEDINELQKLGIMIDADEEGYLLQILPSQLKIVQHFSLKLFKEWVLVGLVQVTLKPF